jgi:hypothetical protein
MPRQYDPLSWLTERGILKASWLSQFDFSAWRMGLYIVRCWCCFFVGFMAFGTNATPQYLVQLVAGHEILRKAPYGKIVENSLRLAHSFVCVLQPFLFTNVVII